MANVDNKTRARWWARWFETDFSWEGLAKKEIPGGGHFGEKTLQDYWRRSLSTGKTRTDTALKRAGELVEFDGGWWHIAHLPPHSREGAESWKARADAQEWTVLDALVAARLAAAVEARGTFRSAEEREYLDSPLKEGVGRARFDGAVVRSDPFPSGPEGGRLHFSCVESAFLGSIDFSTLHFGFDAQFDRAIFYGDAFFDSTNFLGEACFNGATFCGDTRFKHAVFSGKANFDGVIFSDVNFGDAAFSGEALFLKAIFTGVAHFDATVFSSRANFSASIFLGGAHFHRAKFSSNSSFYEAKFLSEAHFSHASFSGRATFGGGIFSSWASFQWVKFSNYAEFDGRIFSGRAIFYSSTFLDFASFDRVIFSGQVQFQRATFSRDASFDPTTFAAGASFDSAQFAAGAKFSGDFNGMTSFARATFESAFEFSAAIIRPETDFAGAFYAARFAALADFSGAVAPNEAGRLVAAFEECQFEKVLILTDGTDHGSKAYFRHAVLSGALGGKDKERDARLRRLEAGCRTVKIAMGKVRDELREQRYYRFQLISRQQRSDIGRWEKAFGLLYSVASDFGSSLWRPLLALVLFTALCGQGYAVWSASLARGRFAPIPSRDFVFEGQGVALAALKPFATIETPKPRYDLAKNPEANGKAPEPTVVGVLTHNAAVTLGLRVTSALQVVVSTLLLFLFGLAVKRRFQIS